MPDYLNLTAGELQVKRDAEASFERRCADCDRVYGEDYGDGCTVLGERNAEIVRLCKVLKDVKAWLGPGVEYKSWAFAHEALGRLEKALKR